MTQANKIPQGERELKECKICNIVKVRYYEGIKSGTGVYIDPNGRWWSGRVCPECRQKKHKAKYPYKKRNRVKVKKICQNCHIEFETENNRKIVCSASCRIQLQHAKRETSCSTCGKINLGRSKYCKTGCKPKAPKKPRPPKPILKKQCPTCQCQFETTTKLQVGCKPSHAPGTRAAHKRSKHARKSRFKSKISRHYAKQIAQIYDNAAGAQVDHIIPQSHPDVCGLHVPWNMQLLDSETNLLKSNLWDGTMDNLNWRKNI